MGIRILGGIVMLFLVPIMLTAQDAINENENASTVGPWTIGGSFNYNSTNRDNLFLQTDLRLIPQIEQSSSLSINPVLTYGLTNYLSANLLLGYTRQWQTGTVIIQEVNGNFINVPLKIVENQYSVGVSMDRYMILKDFYGFRLELGVVYTDAKNAAVVDAYVFDGNSSPEQRAIINGKTIGSFFSPNIDFFIGNRINIAVSMGNIGYVYNVYEGRQSGENKTWEFESNIALDDIGLGIEFNF